MALTRVISIHSLRCFLKAEQGHYFFSAESSADFIYRSACCIGVVLAILSVIEIVSAVA
jgi:hypothetical protein